MTMTDEEIKKALECCVTKNCTKCPITKEFLCMQKLREHALALINRQQAEIEQLKSLCTSNDVIIKAQEAEIEQLQGNLFTISNACMQRRNEAIKEFAEKLKEKQRTFIGDEYAYEFIPSIEIDVLLAEMVGGENA